MTATQRAMNFDLTSADADCPLVRYERKPLTTPNTQAPIDGLYVAWITLDNQKQLNSYTTDMIKAVIAAFRRASNERDLIAVVFTGCGNRMPPESGRNRTSSGIWRVRAFPLTRARSRAAPKSNSRI